MSNIPVACPKCQGVMVQGFVADVTHATVLVEAWTEGPPQKSFWTGIKASTPNRLPIATFRCASCGYLESYAGEEYAAK
jgi:hypothetical protein